MILRVLVMLVIVIAWNVNEAQVEAQGIHISETIKICSYD